jgi:hypothetical protein
MRFICEIANQEHLIDAESFEDAARAVAERHAAEQGTDSGTFTVTVSEANEADFPLIAGNDYTVTLPA